MIKLKDVLEKYRKYENCEIDETVLEYMLVNPYIERFAPEVGQQCYVIEGYDTIENYLWSDDDIDNLKYELNLVFRTYGECEKAIEIRRAFLEASFIPDWRDNRQWKYYIYYNYYDNKFYIGCQSDYNHNIPYYFEGEEIAQQLLDRFDEQDILKYIFNNCQF